MWVVERVEILTNAHLTELQDRINMLIVSNLRQYKNTRVAGVYLDKDNSSYVAVVEVLIPRESVI